MKKKAAVFFAAAALAACLPSVVFYHAASAAKQGALDPLFGESGRLYFNGFINGIVVSDGAIYVSLNRKIGRAPNPDPRLQSEISINVWTIEKISLAAGAPDPSFGANGALNTMATSSYAGPIAAADGFLYAVGGPLDWYHYLVPQSASDLRVEKRDAKTSALDTQFGSGGILALGDNDCLVTDIAAADGFIYLAGAKQVVFDPTVPIEEQPLPKICIEKRSASTGALDRKFGENGAVFLESGINTSAGFAKIKLDGGYIYLFGPGNHNRYITKLRTSDGSAVPFQVIDPGAESDIVFDSRSIYVGGGGGFSLDWIIEKRDKQTGALDDKFGINGIVDEPRGYITVGALELDGGSLYAAGDSRVALGMLQKRSATTGRLDPSFGTGGTIGGKLAGAIEGSGKHPQNIPYHFSAIDAKTHALYFAMADTLEKRLLAADSETAAAASSGELTGVFFEKTLRRGVKNDEVFTLQTFLSSMPEVYPEGLVTGYFGPLTERAVQRFQKKYGIVASGDPDSTGYGQVGPLTRGKLNELLKVKEGPG